MQRENIGSQESDSESLNKSSISTSDPSSPISTSSPHSSHSSDFRSHPINPELTQTSSLLGINQEELSQRLQLPNPSSITTTSSLSPSSNPLVSSSSPSTVPIKPNTSSTSKTIKATSSKMPGHAPTTIYELPIPGSKFAPKKFTGKYSRAKRFTDHYLKLIGGISNMTNVEKCENLMQYCSTKVSDFLEQMESYRKSDFNQLIKDIHDYYDVQLSESRWKEKDLIKLVKQYKGSKIKTLSQWKAYNRRFLRIANWLLNKGLIDIGHYKTYFWDGINRNLQDIFEARIISKNPAMDLTKPFSVEEVQKIANHYFMRDKFATLVEDSEDSDSESESFESTDEEDSSSSDDSDDDYKRKKKKDSKYHSKAKCKLDYYRKKLQSAKDEKDSYKSKHEAGSSSKKESKTSAELDDLINQLQKLSVDSPAYGITYYKATKLDRNLINCLRKPVTHSIPAQPIPTYQQKRGFKPGDRVYNVNTGTNSNAIPIQNTGKWQQQPRNGPLFNPTNDDRCFGCGGRGHGIRGCQKITEMIQAGIVTRSPTTGQITMSDGSYIRKQQNETLAEAAERIAGITSEPMQVAMIRPTTFFCDPDEDYDSDTESDYEFEQEEEDQSESQLYYEEDDMDSEEEEIEYEYEDENDEDENDCYYHNNNYRSKVYIGPEK